MGISPSCRIRVADFRSNSEKEDTVRERRFSLTLAVSIIWSLSCIVPIQMMPNAPDIILALASFTREEDPWVTYESFSKSSSVLKTYTTRRRSENCRSFWSVIEYILKERLRPLFSKARNPAITAAGRKNFHSIPLPRFDASVLDPETKPWKIRDVYATTVFSWVVSQYLVRSSFFAPACCTDPKRFTDDFPSQRIESTWMRNFRS